MYRAFNDDNFPSPCLALVPSPGSEQTVSAIRKSTTIGSYTNMLLTSAALLLAMTTTATLVQPTGARSSSSHTFFAPSYSTIFSSFSSTVFSSSSFQRECATEIISCALDDTCDSCYYTIEVNTAELYECVEDSTVNDPDSSTADCSVFEHAAWCFDKLTDSNCLQNDNFHDIWLCEVQAQGCSLDEITCDADSVAAGTSSGKLATVGHASLAVLTALFIQLFSLF